MLPGRAGVVDAVDGPGLLWAFHAGPFVPSLGRDNCAASFQQWLPVAVDYFVQAGVDGDGDLA